MASAQTATPASAAPASAAPAPAKAAPAPAKDTAPVKEVKEAKAPAKSAPAKAAPAPAKSAPAKSAPAAKSGEKKAEKKAEPPVKVAKFAAARQLVTVFNKDGKEGKTTIKMPNVLLAPIRQDIVRFVHTSMAKNRRQAYAVSEGAGHQHSAESWGTGRAVARIPRVSGGGTSRAGQGAFGNQCRAGRMFAPTKTWRKWHRKINTNQKRYAVASALAASAVTALVQARGHRIDEVPEVPLVLESAVESIEKTKDAVGVLEAVSATSDVDHARDSRKLRRGKGKMRNRRHVQRRGPLVIYNEDKGITRAFRNLPGVELCHVERLNLLQLAPGGHLGRFIVWTQSAFARLDEIWGSTTRVSAVKKGYTLPYNVMLQTDLPRLINSDEVQTKVRAAIKTVKTARTKKNPLTNLGTMVHLNPYALALKRSQLLTEERRAKHRSAIIAAKRAGPRADGKKADIPYNFEEKSRRAADAKHGKTHNQFKNYQRISGVGKSEPKLEQPKIDIAKMQADNEAAAKALAPAAPAKGAEKKEVKAAAPAAKTTDGKAAPAGAKAAGDKKDDKKGGEKKGDDKKGGDAKGKADGGKKEKGGDGGKKEKGGDAGKKGGDGGKKGGDGGKKGGDAKKA